MKGRKLSIISWATRVVAIVVLATVVILAAGAYVLWPAYKNPASRLYTTKLGYLNLQRLLHFGFDAEAIHPTTHDFDVPILGEGTMQANFYNVPIVPTADVKELKVEEGDEVKAGQLLAKLDSSMALLNISSAQLALANAKAEKQRVEAGSVDLLVAERPEKDQVSLEGLAQQVADAKAKVKMFTKLEEEGASAKLESLKAKMELASAETSYNQAKVSTDMSSAGFPKSKDIARNAVDDAENQLKQRKEALKYYDVTAPADGIVDRVLVRNGEYNQSPGNTGFIVASGLWFEANVDQRAIGNIHEGMDATVNFEAYPGRSLPAKVERIVPIVTFNAGGPETTTPVRPLGTGSPEWPATFKVRLQVDATGVKLRPGMTGFARIVTHHRDGLAVPRDAVSSLSAGKGVVRTVDPTGKIATTLVTLGDVDDQFVEITGGLNPSDWILSKNPRYLRDDDQVRVTRVIASKE
jgi:multidrug efflux pump subunit AcrA (membrane-fusion protein)